MTNKTLIAGLLATAGNTKARKGDRVQAFAALEAHFAESKLRMPPEIAALKAELETTRERGVCDLIRELVMDDSLSWDDVAKRCRREFPGASTSAKSVASIARDMRKDGIPVAHRTKRATPKVAAAFASAIEGLEDMEFESVDLDDEGQDDAGEE